MFRLKPRIEISPYIAIEQDNEGNFYTFKIANKSKRPIINLKADLSLAKSTNVTDGPIYEMWPISLRRDQVFEISGYSSKDRDADYALRFVTKTDLNKLWENDADIIRFRVMATDSLSGFSKCFLKEFRMKRNCLKEGTHRWGTNLDIH